MVTLISFNDKLFTGATMSEDRIDSPHYLERLNNFAGPDLVKVITGVRRCGKSSLMMMYKNWLEKEFGTSCVVYIRLDSPEFILSKTLDFLVGKLQKTITDETRYILLDEVQLIKGWEKAVNAYYSTGKYEITITGSNAQMLSGDLATLLTGRYVEIEMLPLSFKEFLSFKNNKDIPIDKAFDEYILYGGFPVIALLDDYEQKTDILRSIQDSILFNDVRPVAGMDVNNETLTRLVAFLNDAIGYPVSMNSLANKIKSAGYRMYYELLSKYMNALKAAFLFYNSEFHVVKGGARFGQADKYYPVDTGLVVLTKANLSENYGSLLETVIFLELKRRGYKISIGKNDGDGSEVDFIATKGNKKAYLQVTATLLDEMTRRREFHALEAIQDNYPKYILSMDTHDFSDNGIICCYIPDFLLDDEGPSSRMSQQII